MLVKTRPALRRVRVLGVEFFAGSLDEAVDFIADGGLLTAPSGIGMAADLVREPAYRRALGVSDLVLTDSGLLVTLWQLRTGQRLPRHSGLKFLRRWFERPEMHVPGTACWVMPSEGDAERARVWLNSMGVPAAPEDFHVAPWYGAGEICDEKLLAHLEARRPALVYLGIGGGVQERLGCHLREQLTYRPTILCLGAALAFLTGAQVRIPPWVDRARLGWLWRVVSHPRRFAGRYFRALRLVWLVMRYGRAAPPLKVSTCAG
ncbi:MAG TPA: WecB/TagA/CpsF family glycosyltransferase [Acidobacteriota bacterium]|nr:WecB/TagA/CpsF family glycosyltransferase [Acidobacteriota bacterium]